MIINQPFKDEASGQTSALVMDKQEEEKINYRAADSCNGTNQSAASSLTGSLPVRLQWAGRPDGGIFHRLTQLLLFFSLLLGDVLLLHLTVLQLVLQLHIARLQQAAERRTALLRPRLEGEKEGGREGGRS